MKSDDTRENYSYGANSIRDGVSIGKNRLTRPIVTYSEIMSMDALSCYLLFQADRLTTSVNALASDVSLPSKVDVWAKPQRAKKYEYEADSVLT